jgi:hypothetical protein
LLQALQAKNSDLKQAHEVELASLRMQSKRENSALEAKLSQSSTQYVSPLEWPHLHVTWLIWLIRFRSLLSLKKSLLMSGDQNTGSNSIQMSLLRAERVLQYSSSRDVDGT